MRQFAGWCCKGLGNEIGLVGILHLRENGLSMELEAPETNPWQPFIVVTMRVLKATEGGVTGPSLRFL